MNIKFDRDTAVKFRGRHKEVGWEVVCHNFRSEDNRSYYDFPCMWATYVFLTEEMHAKLKERINSAPWNGGQTYYRKVTEEHIDVSPELAEKWNLPYYKIGDDFSHLWDMDDRRFEMYDREYMERHIKRVIDHLLSEDTEG